MPAFGKAPNRELLAAVVAELDVKVELSGGIRDDDSLARRWPPAAPARQPGHCGAGRPDWCRKASPTRRPDRRRPRVINEGGSWRLRGRGWVTDGGDLWEVLERLSNDAAPRYVVTDVSRTRPQKGPNLELLAGSRRDVAPIVASVASRRSGSGGDRRTRAARVLKVRSSARPVRRTVHPRRWRQCPGRER